MSVRNLEFLLKPSSVALIGASPKASTVGAVIFRNLSTAGFRGEIYPVNPNYEKIKNARAYPDIASLPKAPDLAVIATPRDTVPEVVAQLGERGTKAAVVITAGFAEGGCERDRELCNAMLDAAGPHGLRIVGPNCLGIMAPHLSLNASMAHLHPLPGNIAFVAQSGAVQTALLDWATSRSIGFSHFISLGDMADVDFGDVLDYLAVDIRTRAILLYMETVTHARKFMSAARTASRMKPVIVVKSGRSREGARAAACHTGAVAGDDAIYDAVFRRAGMLRVYDMQSLFDAVETLAMMPRMISGDRLAILTNGGGVGVIATDDLIDRGGRLAELSARTVARLNNVLPPTWSHANPIDIMSDAPASRYADALEALLDDGGVDAVLILNCPIAVSSGAKISRSIIDTMKKYKGKPKVPILLTSWLGEPAAARARRLFAQNRIPTYRTPTDAVRAFMHMVRYRRSQETLMETVPSIPEAFTPDTEKVERVIARALAEDRSWLTEIEAKTILEAYSIPVVMPHAAGSPEEAESIARELGTVVDLRILSPDLENHSDMCDVSLNLETPEIVRETAAAMMDGARRMLPDAQFPGFTVQPMIRHPHAHELFISMIHDAQFGPVISFGHGGAAKDVINDKAYALPPLNMRLAREVMHNTRVCRLLDGYRCMPPADKDSIALTLVKVSQLISDMAEIVELEINPLLADANGVVALNGRIRAARATQPAPQRFAIRPYPKELEETLTLSDGRTLLIRPIKPEDEPRFQKIFASLSPQEVRMRFLHPMQTLSHSQAARLTQIDYDREMALVLAGEGESGEEELYGSVRIIADSENEHAEYAILVHRDMAGRKLGRLLMQRIIDYARGRGIKKIVGQVLCENKAMLRVCEVLGFKNRIDLDDPGVIIVTLTL
jgi:acetyltransferase